MTVTVTVTLTLALPEPPTLNTMLRLAKQKTRRGPGGAWLQKSQSKYWVEQQDYQQAVRAELARVLGVAARERRALPPQPWPRWRIVGAHYRVHQLRDPIELAAGLKWAADALVDAHLVFDDSCTELAHPPAPTQVVARRNRGLDLTVAPGWLS